jgi:hypothetical protein
MDWRVAAGVTLMLAAGGAIASVVRDDPPPGAGAQSALVAGRGAAIGVDTGARVDSLSHISEPVVAVASADLAVGGLSDLDEGDLEALLQEIEQLDGLPSADPDPSATPVSATFQEEGR